MEDDKDDTNLDGKDTTPPNIILQVKADTEAKATATVEAKVKADAEAKATADTKVKAKTGTKEKTTPNRKEARVKWQDKISSLEDRLSEIDKNIDLLSQLLAK